MLSSDLESLRAQLARYSRTGMVLRAGRVRDVVAILDAAIADAEALEACYVKAMGEAITEAKVAGACLDDIPGNVASLDAYRQQRLLDRYFIPVLATRPLPDHSGPEGAA